MEGLEERVARIEGSVDQMAARLNHLETQLMETRREFREGMTALRGEMKGEIDGLRQEMVAMRQELRGEIDGLRQEMVAMRQELREEMNTFRLEVRGEISAFRQEIRAEIIEMRRWFLWLFITILTTWVTIMLALFFAPR